MQIFFLTSAELTPKSNSVVFISLFDFTSFIPTFFTFGLLKIYKLEEKRHMVSHSFSFVYFLFQYKWLTVHGENMGNKVISFWVGLVS